MLGPRVGRARRVAPSSHQAAWPRIRCGHAPSRVRRTDYTGISRPVSIYRDAAWDSPATAVSNASRIAMIEGWSAIDRRVAVKTVRCGSSGSLI